jgi:hypothetical protein
MDSLAFAQMEPAAGMRQHARLIILPMGMWRVKEEYGAATFSRA